MNFLRRRTASAENRAWHAHGLLSLVMSLQLVFPGPLLAHSVHSARSAPNQNNQANSSVPSGATNLDLRSSNRTVTAGSLLVQPTVIREGGARRIVSASDLLTPAEFVAVQEVLSTGLQTIRLGATGRAVGGSLRLTPDLLQQISSLVIPRRVTAIQDFSSTGPLNLLGNLYNAGRFYAISTSPQVTTAAINAGSIFNQRGALLSSVLPSSGSSGLSNLVGNLSLELTAVDKIVNAGAIISAGSLTARAAGSIINALPVSVIGVSPVMQAASNVNLQATNIENGGLITSQLGTINAYTPRLVNFGTIQSPSGSVQIANLSGNTLAVDNTSGLIAAQNSIVFQTLGTTPQSKAQLSVLGGTVSAEAVSFLSPDGQIGVEVDRMDGNVKVSGGAAEIGVRQGNLNLADVHLTGDPIFYAQNGSLDLSGLFSNPTFSTSGGDFVALASGDITATSAPANATVDATSGSRFSGGDIVMAAGANFTVNTSQIGCTNCSNFYSVVGASTTGGSINLPNVSLVTNNDITLTARSAGGSGGSVTIGSINTKGNQPTGSGEVLVVADGVISSTGINTSAVGSGSGARIALQAAALLGSAPAGTLTLSANGAGTGSGGQILVRTSGNLVVGPTSGGLILLARGGSPGSTSGDGGFVRLFAHNLTLDPGSLDVSPQGTNGNGGNVLLSLDSSGTLTPVTGSVVNASGVGTGNGGSIEIVTQSLQVTAGPVTLAANGVRGNGGAISVSAFGQTNIVIGSGPDGLIISATGGSGSSTGNGGSLQLNTAIGGNLTLDPTSLKVGPQGANGNGGSINILVNGNMNFANGGVVNANGAGNGNGGSINIQTRNSLVPTVPVTVAANGAGTGNGGFIILGGTDMVVGSGAGFTISATGGSSSGDGGEVRLLNGNLTLNPASLDVRPLGTNGKGGTILVSLASTRTLNLLNGGVLDARGAGTGAGGSISLFAGTFLVPAGAVTLTANGGDTGDGGAIIVSTPGNLMVGSGAGGLIISATGGSLGSPFGRGGSVILGAAGTLTLDPAALTVAPRGTNGRGGSILINAPLQNIFGYFCCGPVNVINGGVLDASGVGNETGGVIEIHLGSPSSLSAGPVTLAANGGDTGRGGDITLDSRSDLTIGSGVDGLIISAKGGTLSGNGGFVQVTTAIGRNLTLDPAALNVAPQGNGNGGSINLGTSFVPVTSLNLVNGGVLNVSGVGSGNGGSISLRAQTVQVTPAGPVTLAANGAGSGSGGVVRVFTGSLQLGSGPRDLIISKSGGSLGGQEGTVIINCGDLTIDERSGSVISLLNPNDQIHSDNLIYRGASLNNNGTIVVFQAFSATSAGSPISLSNAGSLIAASLSIIAHGGSATLNNEGAISTSGQIQIAGNGGMAAITGSGSLSAGGGTTLTSHSGPVDVSQGSISGLVTGSADTYFKVATTSSGISAGNIATGNGPILLVAGTGVLSVADSQTLNATSGNVILQNLDTSNGSVVIGSNAQIIAFATNKPQGGNIFVVVGPIPATPVSGTAPSNVNVQQQNGGMVYFGANPITVSGTNNNFSAIGSNIVINNGGASVSSITFNGGNYLNADPPFRPQVTATGAKVIVSTSGVSSRPEGSGVNVFSSQTHIAELSLSADPFTGSQWSPSASSPVTPADTVPATVRTGDGTRILPDDSADDGGTLTPIAFVSPTAVGIQTLQTVTTGRDNTLVKHNGYARVVEREPGVLALHGGEILVSAAEPTTVTLGRDNLALAAGSVVLVTMSEDSIIIRTLWDRGKNSVRATVRGRALSIPVGHELIVGFDDSAARSYGRDNVGRRRTHTSNLGEGVSMVCSEVSLVSLMQSNSLLKQLLRSRRASDAVISRKLLKMAASLVTTTGYHGAYSQARL